MFKICPLPPCCKLLKLCDQAVSWTDETCPSCLNLYRLDWFWISTMSGGGSRIIQNQTVNLCKGVHSKNNLEIQGRSVILNFIVYHSQTHLLSIPLSFSSLTEEPTGVHLTQCLCVSALLSFSPRRGNWFALFPPVTKKREREISFKLHARIQLSSFCVTCMPPYPITTNAICNIDCTNTLACYGCYVNTLQTGTSAYRKA